MSRGGGHPGDASRFWQEHRALRDYVKARQVITGAVRLILVWQTHSKFVDFRVKHAGGRGTVLKSWRSVRLWDSLGTAIHTDGAGAVDLRDGLPSEPSAGWD